MSKEYQRNHPEETKARGKKYQKEHLEKFVEYQFRKTLKERGITQEQYNDLLENQDNKCFICQGYVENTTGIANRLSIDHNHQTGEVRGLLCQTCNLGLGNLKDNIENLQRAIEYLTIVPARKILIKS